MAIYQGFNLPEVIILPEEIGTAAYAKASLKTETEILKEWDLADMTIDGQVVILPIRQSESAEWPVGMAKLNLEWLYKDGEGIHGINEVDVPIRRYREKTVLGTDPEVTTISQEIETSLLPDPSTITAEMIRNALVVLVPNTDPEQIAKAVAEYLEKHPITVTETDPTVPEWAKAAEKPTYTAEEVGALPDSTVIPLKTSELTNDSGFLTEHQSLAAYITRAIADETYQPKGSYAAAVHSHAESDVTGLTEALAGKQGTISDLDTIRSGAAAGATAVQPEAGKGLSTNDFSDTYKTEVDTLWSDYKTALEVV